MSKKGENIRKRKDGRWEGRYKRGRKESGEIIYSSVYGQTYREVKEKMRVAMTSPKDVNPPTVSADMTFAILLRKWQESNEIRLKGGTKTRYENLINSHIIPELATRCIEAGVDVKSLSEILGHANVSITLNTYVHSSLEMKKSQLEKLTLLSV